MSWTTPKTWSTDEVITSAIFNTHTRDNLNAIDGLFDTITPASTARVLGTIYQNTTGKIMFVIPVIRGYVANELYVRMFMYCASTTPPTTSTSSFFLNCGTLTGTTTRFATMATFVPPNFYYYVTVTSEWGGGDGYIENWVEYTLA